MNKRVLNILEFHKITDKLADHASSEPGKDRARTLEISTNLEEIQGNLQDTEEAVQVLTKRSTPPMVGISDHTPSYKRLAMGGALEIGQIMDLGDALRGARYLREFFKEEEAPPRIQALVRAITPLRQVEDRISQVILSETEIADDASPSLKRIRQSMVKKKSDVRTKLNQWITGDGQKYLQDSIVTMREGRYVLPVKRENKSTVKGLVHDTSASGATVFIEPMAVVELNNQLRELEIEERQEILKILKDLSDQLASHLDLLEANDQIMGDLDFIFAKGKLALSQNANRPDLTEKGELHLLEARHPLLDPRKVVAIDVDLGGDFTSLIITGPNTGGKTVTLKTVGLLTLMTQAGLFIPAASQSVIRIFHEIYADIGDEQSIEQSLSTFSSHMVHIVDILKKASPLDLVLFDELGAGTDPTEGAALAMSVIDSLLQEGILTMATTHYNQLKIYALTQPGVANAGMEFDLETLSPTYRLRIGSPGKSNAFEISRRLGMPEKYIDKARSYIHEDSLKFEDVLEGLEAERQSLSKHKKAQEASRSQLEKVKKDLDRELDKTQREKDRYLKEAREEARKILAKAKEEAELALLEIKEAKGLNASDRERKVQQARSYLGENLRGLEKDGPGLVLEKVAKPIKEVKVGDTVYSKSLGQKGQVLEGPDNSGQVLVQLGILKVNLPLDSLTFAESEERERGRVQTKSMISQKSKNLKTEIDLRGKTFDEARPLLEKYLDDAYLSGLKTVRIIHGKGTGVLREKVRAFLKAYHIVTKYEDAKASEGGYGVTLAYLK